MGRACFLFYIVRECTERLEDLFSVPYLFVHRVFYHVVFLYAPINISYLYCRQKCQSVRNFSTEIVSLVVLAIVSKKTVAFFILFRGKERLGLFRCCDFEKNNVKQLTPCLCIYMYSVCDYSNFFFLQETEEEMLIPPPPRKETFDDDDDDDVERRLQSLLDVAEEDKPDEEVKVKDFSSLKELDKIGYVVRFSDCYVFPPNNIIVEDEQERKF